MNMVIEVIGFTVLVPAIVSIAMSWICWKKLPISLARRCALPVGLAAGLIAGYALLSPPVAWLPVRHWHWLPYVSLMGMIVGTVVFARGIWTLERTLMSLLAAAITACVLVPHWSSLAANRHIYVLSLAVYLWL